MKCGPTEQQSTFSTSFSGDVIADALWLHPYPANVASVHLCMACVTQMFSRSYPALSAMIIARGLS
jgi:hypothetical protein